MTRIDLDFDVFLAGLGGCDPSANYSVTNGSSVGGGQASASCQGSKRKRSTGSLQIRIRFSLKLPKECFYSCLQREVRKLYLQAAFFKKKVDSGRIKVNVTNVQTAEVVEIPLTGRLAAGRPQRHCQMGYIIARDVCGECQCAVPYFE